MIAVRIIIALVVAGLGLSGCIAFQAASAVAGVAVGTVSAVGRAAMAVGNAVTNTTTATSSAVTRSVAQIPARMMYGPYPARRVVIPNRAPPRATRASPQRKPASAPARPASTKTAKAKPAKPTSKERQQILEVLPPEVLDKMTKDELILQTMVQTEALANATDEVIFWELDGHAGTATAETEHRMGTFTCRLLIETAKLDPAEDATATQAKTTVCRTEDTGWTLSF